MEIKTDCLYFRKDSDLENMSECKRKHCYIKKDDNDDCCDCCRLWDAYIPRSASQEEIDKAVKWQNMSYKEQPDYEEYF